MVLTATQVVPYDFAKRKLGGEKTLSTHVLASLFAGVVTTTATSPLDVLKTPLMARPGQARGVFTDLVKEGPSAVWRGWLASYVRVGPHTALTFVLLEQLLGRAV